MGTCCSKPQTSRPIDCTRQSRYRLLRILGRHDHRRKADSYKRGEPDGSEEVESLQKTKKKNSRRSRKKDFLDDGTTITYADESDIEVYPVNHKEISGISEDEDKDENSFKESAVSQQVREQVIKGDVNTLIPTLPKMIKIVVASTHEDMAEERLILDERVFLELRKFCREQNFDVHIIDVNIEDERFNYDDWKDEIKIAHKESTGVGFIVLVGQNLGERCLPKKIDVKDFELLLEMLPSDHDGLRSLYELDACEIPCYVLRKACSDLHEENIEEASQRLLAKMEEDDFKRKCEQQYIFNALLQAASLGVDLSNKSSTAVWIERTVDYRYQKDGFDEQSNDDKAELRNLREQYDQHNASVISYDEFAKYDIMKRNNFHKNIIEKIKEKTQMSAQQPAVNIITEQDIKEVAQHILKCQENVAHVDESQQRIIDIQRRISTYIRANTKIPLVVHGPPGCGKSTMVSMAAKLACDSMVEGTCLVLRFLGSTRHSSNLRFLLKSICFQLSRAFGNKNLIPEDFQSIVKMFLSSLHNATKGRRILIILDGLDELPKSNLLWLPRELPDHVRIILTALTNGGYYNGLKATFEDAADHFIDVGEIDKTEARSYITTWHQSRGSEPSEDLNNSILNAVPKCPNILYLELLLHHIQQKKSLVESADYTEVRMPNSLKHVIEHYFVTMEKKHGQLVIQRIMGYLSAARYGLSERELEEILTREHISGKVPASSRVWSFQLSRILHDLLPLVSKVYFDGMLILTWRHLIIRYLAFDRYLSNREDAVKLTHQSLAQYFAGKHTTGFSEDPLVTHRRIHDLPHYLCKIGDIENLKDLALCNFAFLQAQLKGTSIDYVLECFTGKHCPMDQDLKMIVDALKMSSDALQIDPNQLGAQLTGRLTDLASSDHIARLLNEARKTSRALIPNTGCLNPPGTKLLHTSMELYGPTDLTSDSTLGLSASKNIVALWDVRSGKIIRTTTAGSTVRQVRFCRNNRLFVVDAGKGLDVFETSTFKKIWELECPGTVRAITLAGDSKDVLIAACGNMVRAWNLRSGLMMSEITELEGMFVDKIAGWREYVACASTKGKSVRIYEVFTGVFVTHINVYEKNTTDYVADVFLSSFGDGLVLTSSDTSYDVRVFRLSSGVWLRNIGRDIVNPRLTSDGHYILSTNSRNDISVWSLETGLKLTNVFRHPPTSIITDVIANDLTVLVTLSDNGILRVWDLEKEETIQQGLSQDKHDNCIRNIMFVKSRGEQRQAVSRSKVSGDIVVWNLSNCKPVRILKGTQADDILVVDETRAVLRSMGKLALIDLEEGRLIKKLRVSFPNMRSRSRLERRASSLYKRRNLSLRLLQRSGVTTKPKCAQFSDVAIVGEKYALMLSSKRDVVNLISLDDGESVAKLDSGHKDCIETVLVSDNGKTLVCSYQNSPAAVWNLDKRQIIGWLRVENTCPKLCQAAITRDGKYLVDAVKINDCTHIVVWNIDIAEVQCKIPIKGASVHAVAASSESGILICSFKKEYRNTVMVYTLRSGAQLFPLPCGIRQQINGIQLNLDGKRAMTFISGDRTIRLWDTSRGVQIGSFTADHAVSDCALSDDGNSIVLAIYKASTIASLSFGDERKAREVSVDLNNPYYNPKNYGAVYEFLNILDWDDDTNLMDNTLAEKQ